MNQQADEPLTVESTFLDELAQVFVGVNHIVATAPMMLGPEGFQAWMSLRDRMKIEGGFSLEQMKAVIHAYSSREGLAVTEARLRDVILDPATALEVGGVLKVGLMRGDGAEESLRRGLAVFVQRTFHPPKPETADDCPYCGFVGIIMKPEDSLECPKCHRDGCSECMPAGRGCLCPECAEQEAEYKE